MNPPDMTKRLLAEVEKLVPRLRMAKIPSNWCVPFRIETIAGPLTVQPMDDWLACRFEDVDKAKALYPTHSGNGGRLNHYSGKWNWHWFEAVPHNTSHRPSKALLTRGIDKMLIMFTAEVEKLLPVTQPVKEA